MYSEINFSTAAEPRLFLTTLSSFVKEQQMAHYGAIIICRSGKANIQVNFDDWQLFEGAVITIFPNDVIRLMPDETEGPFLVEMLQYDAAMLREASLQLEHTVYANNCAKTVAAKTLPSSPTSSTICSACCTFTSTKWAAPASRNLYCYSSRPSS